MSWSQMQSPISLPNLNFIEYYVQAIVLSQRIKFVWIRVLSCEKWNWNKIGEFGSL